MKACFDSNKNYEVTRIYFKIFKKGGSRSIANNDLKLLFYDRIYPAVTFDWSLFRTENIFNFDS